MNRLTEIANKQGTDKGTDFREGHSYTEFYEKHFSKYIGKHPKILEIGVDCGASLRMLNDYFDGDCEIYGIDIFDKSMYNTENTYTYIVDQGDRDQLYNFKMLANTKFDIIIDDGSHFVNHQWVSLSCLHDLVSEGGIYVLEDLHMNFVSPYNQEDELSTPLHCLPFRRETYHLTEDENKNLMDAIDTVTIWCYHNLKGEYNNQSITSIITFK
jgi:hypothetical protein